MGRAQISVEGAIGPGPSSYTARVYTINIIVLLLCRYRLRPLGERSGAEYIRANGTNTFVIARRFVPFARRFMPRSFRPSISWRDVADHSRASSWHPDILNRPFRELYLTSFIHGPFEELKIDVSSATIRSDVLQFSASNVFEEKKLNFKLKVPSI